MGLKLHRIGDYGIEDMQRIGDYGIEDVHRIGKDYVMDTWTKEIMGLNPFPWRLWD